jgi:hypothetical protein
MVICGGQQLNSMRGLLISSVGHVNKNVSKLKFKLSPYE